MNKVLITTPWFYPAFRAGGPVQSIYNLVNSEIDGVEFFVFTSSTDLNNEPLEVETEKWIAFNEKTKVYYSLRQNRSNVLLEEMIKVKADTLYVVGMYSWHFTIVPLFFGKVKHKILSPRGMLSSGALKQKALKKKLYFFLWKSFGLQHKAKFHATDELEKEMIEDFFDEPLPVEVVPNFSRALHMLDLPAKTKGRLVMGSIALISPMKNYLVVLEALKDCSAEIEYNIYGPVKDEEYWNRCKDLIIGMPPNVRVYYHGEISPDGVPEALKRVQVFVLPSVSENFGHAIVEALKAGRPVITSFNTPFAQLYDAKAGYNVEALKDNLRGAIEFFADFSEEEMKQWSAAAAEYARLKYNDAETAKLYRQLFIPAELIKENEPTKG